jgi:hypothetical protein
MSLKKHQGKCPFCSETVEPEVIEENTIRRDMCRCPSCKRQVLICRAPGCQDYAKGGEYYDDEFCPACTQKMSEYSFFAAAAILLGKIGSS